MYICQNPTSLFLTVEFDSLEHGQSGSITERVISGYNKKARRDRRHVGPPDHGGFQRLIQTGCVAPALPDKDNHESRNEIDLVMVTYWMYPAKVRVITDAQKDCIEHYRNLSRQGNPQLKS